MSNLWDAAGELLRKHAVEAALSVIVAAGGALAAWFRKKTREWNAVKETVRAVENESTEPGGWVPGPERRKRALSRLRTTNPGIGTVRASQLIEQVLPDVRAESDRPPPLPKDR